MRVFTEEEKQWVRENYNRMKQCECCKYLHCTDGVLRRVAKEVGVYVARKTYDQKPKLNKKAKKEAAIKTINESGEGYCIDCLYYMAGGHCSKTGKDTGALHKKICFKEK